MNILVLNGSPRKGNTLTAIQAFANGAEKNHKVEILDTHGLDMAPCKGCNACECYKGCVDKDMTNEVIDKIVEADAVIFATPVYWWGMTAQLKLVIDKCFCRGALLKGKKVGVIVVGGSPLEHRQYRIIKDQFDCMVEFLDWELIFYHSFFATSIGDMEQQEESLRQLEKDGESI